jgi:hypothetical protein
MANQVGSQSWTENRLTSRLGLQYPIIQGPLDTLVNEVSEIGGAVQSWSAYRQPANAQK